MKGPRQHSSVDDSGRTPANTPAGNPAKLQAAFVAAGLFDRFQQIQGVLAPVIGRAGVVALYERSRHLSSRSYPWLAASTEGFSSGMDLEELKSLIAQQSDQAAMAGAGFLLKSFHDLLSGLVGTDLTRQLLGAAPSGEPSTDLTS